MQSNAEIKTSVLSSVLCEINSFIEINKVYLFNIFGILIKSIIFSWIIYKGVTWQYMLVTVVYINFLLSITVLLKGRGRGIYPTLINLIITLIFIIDIMYFKAFSTFPTIMSVKSIQSSDRLLYNSLSLININFLGFFLDILLAVILIVKMPNKQAASKISRLSCVLKATFITISLEIFLVFVSWTTITTSSLLYHTYAYVYYCTPFSYHCSDIFVAITENKKITLTNEEVSRIKDWFNQKKENLPDNKYKEMFKGKNIIFLQVESLESFVIGRSVDNQEITPTINKLLNNSIYFSSIYEQVKEGKSSDAHLIVNTSIYPAKTGSTFYNYPYNVYNSFPQLIEKLGYSTLAVYAVNKRFWNWGDAMTSIGFDNLLDITNFNVDEAIGLGISDGTYLKQIEPILLKQKQPFHSEIATDTSHMPFDLPEQYRDLKLNEELNNSFLGDYFQSIHYTDKQIGLFIDNLKKDGLLDNTIIVVYGDHEGVHRYYNDSIQQLKQPKDWWLTNDKKVPLIVYSSNLKSERIDTIGGQVDILPTIGYLVGLDENDYNNTAMGRNLLKTSKNFAVLSDGKYIGTVINEKQKEHEMKGLDIADLIIRGNYFNNN